MTEILMRIQRIWEKYPDQRLLQLIINAVRPKDPCSELYALADMKLMKKLEGYAKKAREGRRSP